MTDQALLLAAARDVADTWNAWNDPAWQQNATTMIAEGQRRRHDHKHAVETLCGVMADGRPRRLPKGMCSYCDDHRRDSMMPNHFASTRCESGKHNHCTCDTCF